MSVASERAKSSWLLAFGDVVTLLITFFIMMLAINKGEISKIQAWVDTQVNGSYELLQAEITQKQLQVIEVKRNARGILLLINHDDAFKSGRFEPTETLTAELQVIGQLLPKVPVLNMQVRPESFKVIEQAKQDGFEWLAEVNVEGHTDNDDIDPRSRLRNNWFLSTLRAESVMQALYESSGLPAKIFSVAGYGEYQPRFSNSTAVGKAKNRRVEVLITASFQKSTEL